MSPTTAGNLAALAVLLKRDWRMLIGGELIAETSGETTETVPPYDGSSLARVPLAGPHDVDAAVRAARSAFPAWRDTPLPNPSRPSAALPADCSSMLESSGCWTRPTSATPA